MARKRPLRDAGTVVVLEHRSSVLADNPLGDPHVRKLAVWLPPAYDRRTSGPGARFPVLYDLVGFTGAGIAHLNWKPFSDNVAERAARLIHDGRMGPAIIVFPDCFTSLGGNQYVNSSRDRPLRRLPRGGDRPVRGPRVPHAGLARAPRLLRQVLRRLRRDDPRHALRASTGARSPTTAATPTSTSSTARTGRTRSTSSRSTAGRRARPGASRRRATRPPNAACAEGLDDGRVRRFLERVWKKPKVSGAEVHAIMNLCMAATYDPDPQAPLGFRLPFHLETGEIIERRWQQWLEHDPVRLVEPPRAQPAPPQGPLHRLRLARPVPHPLRRRGSCRAASPPRASPTATRSSTTTTPTSTTAWTRACHSCIGRCAP